jgi:hypothetical protein
MLKHSHKTRLCTQTTERVYDVPTRYREVVLTVSKQSSFGFAAALGRQTWTGLGDTQRGQSSDNRRRAQHGSRAKR